MGERVLERVGAGEAARDSVVEIVWEGPGVVMTATGLEYDAFTGMRVDKHEAYRSIRRIRQKARRLTPQEQSHGTVP